MPEYLYPGVYLEEIERGPRPIEGVPTSTAAFLGETERGPLRPHLVTSFKDYQRSFGTVFRDGCFMPHAVNGFFENGGKRLYVCRIVGEAATLASKVYGDFTVSAVGPGAWGKNVWVKIQNGSTKDAQNASVGFRVKLAYWTTPPATGPFDPFLPANRSTPPRPQIQEDYDDLSVDPLSSDFFVKRLFDATNLPVSALAVIERIAGTNSKPPTVADDAPGEFLDQGGEEDPAPLGRDDFTGDLTPARQHLQGIRALALDPFRDVALVYAPYPRANADDIHKAIIDHCELLRFRFAAIDSDKQTEPDTLDPRTTIQDTQYAGFYAPWIYISDLLSGARVPVPPTGHVLGVYARSDNERGVFKAPANEVLRGAIDVFKDIDDGKQAVMNPRGVNAIRRFPGRGIRVWGARYPVFKRPLEICLGPAPVYFPRAFNLR